MTRSLCHTKDTFTVKLFDVNASLVEYDIARICLINVIITELHDSRSKRLSDFRVLKSLYRVLESMCAYSNPYFFIYR